MNTHARWNSMAVGAVALGVLVACSQPDTAASDPEPAEVPALSEIEDAMWESMLAADSVRVSAAGDSIVEAMPEVAGIESETFSWSGAVDGTAIAVHYDNAEDAHLYFDDTIYVDGDIFYALYEEAAEDIDLAPLGEDLTAMWVLAESFSGNSQDFSTIDAIESMRDTTEGSEVSEDGTLEDLDGQSVWKYPTVDGDGWVKIAADVDRPYLLQSHSPEGTMTYSGWDDTEIPVEPAPEDVVTEQSVYEAAEQLAQQH